MSSKTKILVLKSRNLIWTAVIVVIIILLAVLLASALHLDENQSRSLPKDMTESAASSAIVSNQSFSDSESIRIAQRRQNGSPGCVLAVRDWRLQIF